MSKKLQPVRGTKDLLPDEQDKFNAIIDMAKHVSTLYGFREMNTPIFEATEVFQRSIGETSDIVSKEMYTFESKGGESLTLRPEFTAGIVRAFISNGMQQDLPLKLFSYGPLFRYERPQKGRQRQFHQVNFEWLGNETPMADIEMIAMADKLLKKLGIKDYTVEINSLGSKESRAKYIDALKKYLSDKKDQLSEDSKVRLEKNPLRILDSKDEGDKKLLKNAPIIIEYLSDEDKAFLEKVEEGLKLLSINYKVNDKIVRGLDYYNDVVFEFVSTSDDVGAQNTILAGGRYDGLVSGMGGGDVPAVGFAAGIERLALLADAGKYIDPITAILPGDGEEEESSFLIADRVREAGFSAEIYVGGNFNKRMKKANKAGADLIIIVKGGKAEDFKFDTQFGEDKAKKIKEVL